MNEISGSPEERIKFVRYLSWCSIAGYFVAFNAGGQLVIDVGTHELLANKEGQEIQLFVENEGDDPVVVSGLNLNIQILEVSRNTGTGIALYS